MDARRHTGRDADTCAHTHTHTHTLILATYLCPHRRQRYKDPNIKGALEYIHNIMGTKPHTHTHTNTLTHTHTHTHTRTHTNTHSHSHSQTDERRRKTSGGILIGSGEFVSDWPTAPPGDGLTQTRCPLLLISACQIAGTAPGLSE